MTSAVLVCNDCGLWESHENITAALTSADEHRTLYDHDVQLRHPEWKP